MIEKRVVSYGYIPETKVMMARASHEAVLSYSQFEEDYLNKQPNKMNAKMNARRRAEKSRKALRGSDAESDTSDGFTVNSGGSGRSGDWGPPKIRPKPKYSRKRCEQRASFTDSGISLTKTDSGDLSELSYQYDREKFFVHQSRDPYSDSSHERCSQLTKQHAKIRTQSKIESTNQIPASSIPSPIAAKKDLPSLKRANSCSALPSNIKPLDKHNPRPDREQKNQQPTQETSCTDIEEKENAILEQCYRNEGVAPDCADVGCNYIDCQHNTSHISRFPLPDHLNYPLNKYYKSETNLHRLQPLKKIRSSLRKLKNKTQNIHLTTPDRYENYSLSSSVENSTHFDSTLDSSYLDSINEIDNSDAILARLGKNPNSKKTWVKKLFKWNVGKSYIAKNKKPSPKKDDESIIYSEHRVDASLKKRSLSTRSIPEALMNIWSKVSEPMSATTTVTHEFEFTVPTTLTRASSMPSISNHRVAKHQHSPVIYFNEKGPGSDESNKNFFKPIERHMNPTTPNKAGCEVITGVLGQTPQHENNNKLQMSTTPKEFTPQYYTSCQDIRMHPTPPSFHNISTKEPPVHGHCHCCVHAQSTHHAPNQFYQPAPHAQIPYRPENTRQYIDTREEDEMVQPIAYYTKSDFSVVQPVVAPLDMKISAERRAERRRISEMVFDTFV